MTPDRPEGGNDSAHEPAGTLLTFTSSSFIPDDALEAAQRYVAPAGEVRRSYSKLGLGWVMRPDDSEELRLRKTIALLVQLAGVLFTLFWYALFVMMGLAGPARINLIYNALCVLNVVLFAFTKSLALNINIAFALVTVYVVTLQWTLGGLFGSGVVIVWAIMAPLLSSALFGRRMALAWLGIFLAALAVSAACERLFPVPPQALSETLALVNAVLNVGLLSVMVVATNYFLVRRLDDARERADGLLLNVLPTSIATRLKSGQKTLAELHPAVTILFADIVGFTQMAAGADPVTLVAMLNAVFSKFDKLAAQHGLEKIKTIGDAYMVAGGLPNPRTDHAEAVAEMALGMLEAMSTQLGCDGKPVTIRIGIHSGPVVSGVIGKRKFSYDLWGDVVNVASRMESTGAPGRIHVSGETHALLREKYEFDEREAITVKGRGVMQTYFLVG